MENKNEGTPHRIYILAQSVPSGLVNGRVQALPLIPFMKSLGDRFREMSNALHESIRLFLSSPTPPLTRSLDARTMGNPRCRCPGVRDDGVAYRGVCGDNAMQGICMRG